MVRLSRIVLIVLVLVVGTAVTGSIADDTGPSGDTDPAVQRTGGIAAAQEFDRTEFELLIYANGSTRWTFTYKRTLSNETERQQFERYAERFNDEETRLYTQFVDQAETLARLGSEATGREMEARAFERNASVSGLGNQGVVEMSFLWTNFAVVDGERVVVGDLFDGGPFQGGLYLGPNQQLVIRPAGDLDFGSVEPEPDSYSGESIEDSDSIAWRGEREFDNGRPSIEFVPASESEESLPLTVGGVVLLLLGVAAVIAWRFGPVPGPRSESESDSGGRSEPPARTEPGPEPPAGSGSAPSISSEPRPDGETTVDGPVAPEPAVSDEELLSDEDRVVRLLERKGGRMRQANIVEETGWSKSKVSMLLSEMEDGDQVSKLRIGRENIVSLRGHEPDVAGSSFEDDRE